MDDDLPRIIYNQTIALIELLDHYTAAKFTKTGNATNTPACFRDNLTQFAIAAACEMVNPDDKSFSEKDLDKVYQMLKYQ